MTYALKQLLNMDITRFRPTETKVHGVTIQTLAASTGIAGHIQPMSPDEVARAYGYEEVGARYQGFFRASADIQIGDRIKVVSVEGSTANTFSGTHYWVRGLEDNAAQPWIKHKLLHLELTTKST